MARSKRVWASLLGAVLGAAMPAMVLAAPPAGTHGHKQLQSQLQDVDAKISSARTRNGKLDAQVAQLEQQNADRRKQLQQRDEEIVALQKKLQAAGAPASAASIER